MKLINIASLRQAALSAGLHLSFARRGGYIEVRDMLGHLIGRGKTVSDISGVLLRRLPEWSIADRWLALKILPR